MPNLSQICQLAGTYAGRVQPGGMLAQVKVDGWRAVGTRDIEGRAGLFTRNGQTIEGAGHILWRLAQIEQQLGEPYVFDGEFQVGGTLAATKAWCERGWKAGGEAGQLFLFDAIPLARWREGGDPTPLVQRLDRLRGAISATDADEWTWRPGSYGRDESVPPIVMLDDLWLFDEQDVLAEARRVWAAGGEGLMLKDAEAGYERGRNQSWLKVKMDQAWLQRAA